MFIFGEGMMNALSEVFTYVSPIWIAGLIGVLIGWNWKPNWVAKLDVSDSATDSDSGSSQAGAEKGEVKAKPLIDFGFVSGLKSKLSSWNSETGMTAVEDDTFLTECSSQTEEKISDLVTGADLGHLSQLVDEKDGGPSWIQMMDRSTPTMYYQAWRRDPVTGPPQYRSSTIYEDTTPEEMRDFFWDDEFRSKWDDMLLHASTLEECPTTGTMLVHWVRKFPFFCSDREYVIGRRIWESGHSYYCVTKGVPCTSIPRRSKPRRVDLYYSSWFIRAAESKRRSGELTACEVILFHHEDMGIPWEVAKFGVRQGMWGAVRKIEPGLRAYQNHRTSGPASLSRSAIMAQINTKVSAEYLKSLEASKIDTNQEVESKDDSLDTKASGRNFPKLVFLGGAVLLACSLDRGLVTKAVIFGAARKFANIGR